MKRQSESGLRSGLVEDWSHACEVKCDHKTSHKGQYCEIEIYASYESWINSFPLMYGLLW